MSLEQKLSENSFAVEVLAEKVTQLSDIIRVLTTKLLTDGLPATDKVVNGVEGSTSAPKKETPPKSTKKVTAADIVEAATEAQEKAFKQPDIPPEVVEEVSLTDDELEESLTGDEPEVIDYVELRTECRTLINSAVDRVGKPAVVAILDYLHAKSLKDVKDANLPWLRTKLTEAK